MKIKKLLIPALAVTLALGGCNKTGESVDPIGEGNIITVKMSTASGLGRAVGDPVADNTELEFNDGYLFFVNATGHITYIVKVTDDSALGTGSVVVGNEVHVYLGALQSAAGAKINNVPVSSETIEFFGNLPAGTVIPPLYTDLSDLRNSFNDVRSQYDANGGVRNVGIYGKGPIDKSAGAPYSADFLAYAIASRIEINSIVATDDVTDFDIEGIFINNFYPYGDFTGAGKDLTLYTMISTFEEDGEIHYSSANRHAVYDYNPVSYVGSTDTYGYAYPGGTEGKVWAYNIYPTVVPHIVIRLNNIQTRVDSTNEYPGVWYITVTGFSENGVALNNIEKGTIYSIDAINVNEKTLNPNPEPEELVSVNVKVTLIPWKKVEVDPTIPQVPY